jgi:glycosyltransferase involved in cell wall biosynthesis
MVRLTHHNLVCLTPVRNEAWTLERFLRCAETWADIIIILDQASTDGSAEIARRHPKVHLVSYAHTTFDEAQRRKLLVDVARDLVPEPRILVSLDADEIIASDAWQQPEMAAFLDSRPGTIGRMRWINILPSEPRAWIPDEAKDFMFNDDGREFRGLPIHGPRLPEAEPEETMEMTGPKVLHLAYVDWERMKAKLRWYQAWERIDQPRKRPVQLYRQYHKVDAIDPAERHPLAHEWYRPHEVNLGIDLLAVPSVTTYPTDERLIDLVLEHGPAPFRRLDLWDDNWERRATALGRPVPAALLHNPRNRVERAVFRWLAQTQSQMLDPRIRWMQRALRLLGW